jgi:uncharacterized protein YraI
MWSAKVAAEIGMCALALGFATSALAAPALTLASAAMRAEPNSRAPIVQMVPPNAQIDVNSCRGPWCYVSWREVFGYMPQRAIDARPYHGALPAEPTYGGPAPVVLAPTFGFGWGFGHGWGHRW